MLNATAAALRRLYGAASCSVALTVSGGTALRFVAADGEASDQVVGLELPVDKGIAGWVAMSQSQMAVADVTKDPRFARDVAELIGYMPTSILAAPLPGSLRDEDTGQRTNPDLLSARSRFPDRLMISHARP